MAAEDPVKVEMEGSQGSEAACSLVGKTIAVIGGTGALGAAVAKRLVQQGRRVVIGSRDPAKAATVAERLSSEGAGVVSGASVAAAAAAADLCILAVPYAAHAETVAAIRDGVQGKIVVDATVPLRPPRVGTVQLPPGGSAVLEAAAALGPAVRVVSALQNIGAEKLASGEAIDGDVFVAGDDADAVETVRALLSELGLRSWHVGPLANSAAAEALTSLLIQINRRYKHSQAGVRITGRPKDAPVATEVTVRAIPGLPLYQVGDDLAESFLQALRTAGDELRDGDVVVVAQKAVSKVEGRVVALNSVSPGPQSRETAVRADKDPAMVELIAAESQELMRVAPGVIIARHRTGHVLANAGIDASNVSASADAAVLLWPQDPDESARRLRAGLEAKTGRRLAVIISDSLGRAWRMGTTGSAIGVAGMKPLRDRRGETDLFGRELQATVIGVADEIAAAASLVIGEAAEGTPAAVVRGVTYNCDPGDPGVGELLRPLDKDLFR